MRYLFGVQVQVFFLKKKLSDVRLQKITVFLLSLLSHGQVNKYF